MSQNAQLRHDLAAIHAQATSVLQQERRWRAVRPAFEGALLICAAMAAGCVAYLALAHLTSAPAPTNAILVVIVIVPAVFYVVLRIIHTDSQPITPGETLAAADARHATQDRLRTAAEFLGRPDTERSAFMQAALLDAQEFARTVSRRGISPEIVPEGTSGRTRVRGIAAAALLAFVLWLPAPTQTTVAGGADTDVDVAQLDPQTEQRSTPPDDRPPTPETVEETPEQKTSPAARRSAREGRKDSQLSSEVKKTRGVMGSGQSADAASASGASEARGAPSSQAQASLAGKKPGKKKKKEPKKRKKRPVSDPSPPKKPDDDSGATAGRGAASGSNKSPSASPWSSKDQVTSDDEDDLEDDEEVDDEFDNSDARGGVQPHLRDRRPPVNRDLGIGFGNQKNPDANGRGGPSELKKSRGVASLVLGVPIPDHIKGRPNPGKTKITQERVEPKAEDAAPIEAGARQPRAAPVGHLVDPHLEPWMRDLLRAYYRFIRQKNTRTPRTVKSGD